MSTRSIRDKLEKIVGTKLEHPENEDWGDWAITKWNTHYEMGGEVKKVEICRKS